MSLLWMRPPGREARYSPDERRLRDFVDSKAGVSESVASLSTKLGVRQRDCQRVLEQLVREGIVKRREFRDLHAKPLYYRYPGR